MRVGIFGGSFSPVHEGHLALAKEAFSELNLKHLFFVPSFRTPLKDGTGLWPAPLRIRLLREALRPYPYFSISLCEIQRRGESFTMETLKFFRRSCGRGATLYFLAGADCLSQLERWRSVDRIFKLCRFMVMSRPGLNLMKSSRWPVLRLPFEALNVSSTLVRGGTSFGDWFPAGLAPL